MQSEIIIQEFNEQYANDFYLLNKAWIEKYFVMEPLDFLSLENPKEYIIDTGGYILFAEYQNKIVGCCALIKINEEIYELAKMAVDPSAQGKQIGFIIGQAIIEKGKSIGAKKLYLESNTKLTPAINLYRKLGFIALPFHPSEYSRCNIQMEFVL